MKCPYCGRDVNYSDRFCKCGAELDMVVCPNCGTPNITIATFCGNCGHILAGAEPYVPEPEEVEAEESKEAATPKQEPEESAVPEPEPVEDAVPEQAKEEEGIPETESEEEIIPEQTPEEEIISEQTPEESISEQVPDESAETEQLNEEDAVTKPASQEAAETEQPGEEDAVTEPGPEEAAETKQLSEEDVVREPESEEAVAPEEGGGGKRRRGGLIALWIVIVIIVIVVIVLLVWAARGNRGQSTPVENTENMTDAEEEDLASEEIEEEEKETEVAAAVSDVSFDLKDAENNQEYAEVTATDENGNVVWEYTTPKYEKAELDRVSPIGLHGSSYFLVQDGAVVSLDKSNGEVLWENSDYGGMPVEHSWDYAADGLYLCGYNGPAIYGVSYDGETLGKIDAFDDLTDVTETNLWPYKVLVSGREATVLYGPENVLEKGDMAITENEATVYNVNLDTWEYNLISNGAAKVESTSDNNGNGSNSGSGSDNGGSGSDSGSGSGSNSGSGSSGSGSGSGDSSGSGSGSGSEGNGGSGGGSSQAKFSMSDVKEVTASSYLRERNVNISHDPKYLVDGTLQNAWCEDASGDGTGQWAKIEFNGTYALSGMKINAGYQKSETLYYQNCRPKEITITFSDGSSFNTTLEDADKEQTVAFSNTVNTSSVTITIRSVYKGSKYEDTCISEVAFY